MMNKAGILKSRKGSSSVLVIMMMLTLVIFGTLALASSFSDLKLARKSSDWVDSYYRLEGKGEMFKYQASVFLTDAWRNAGSFAEGGDVTVLESRGTAIPEDVKVALVSARNSSGAADVRIKAYYYLANVWLIKQGFTVKSTPDFSAPVAAISGAASAPAEGVMKAEAVFRPDPESDSQNQTLSVSISITAGGKLFAIDKWISVPAQFKYNKNPVFGSGSVGIPGQGK